MPHNIHIYYHIALLGNKYEEIIKNTSNKIVDSGLYDTATSINIGLLGEKNIFSDEKIKIIYQSPDFTEFEYPTLNKLHEHANKEDAHFLYIHTKGVANPSQFSDDWRNYMEYFTIENWEKCIDLLEIYDCVGVNYQNEPYRHYSGNFWWSKSSYLKTLQKPKKTNNRFEYEAWIASGNLNPCSLHNSNINHYYKPYPKSAYKVI